MKRPYLLWKRGQLWYYRLAGEKTFHTTGQTTRGKAESYVLELLRSAEGYTRQRHVSFRLYAEPFLLWGRCPHIRRLREQGKSFTRRHARIQRQRLENHVLKDPLAANRLSEITRADVLDLRSRLLAKNASATANKALGVVKGVFREALYREEIPRDPTAGVGKVKYHKAERGVFTAEELRRLLPDHGCGPWRDVWDSTCFYGQYLGLLGAGAAAVAVTAVAGEFLGYALRFVSGWAADRTKRYLAITLIGYVINLLAVPALALTGRWQLAIGLVFMERIGKAIRNPSRDAMLAYATTQTGRGFGYGLHEAMDQIGAVLGPLLLSLILYLQRRAPGPADEIAGYRLGFLVL